MKPESICLVANGLMEQNLSLQPWRYLFEVGRQLSTFGYQVTLITDGLAPEYPSQLFGIPVRHVTDVRVFPVTSNSALLRILDELHPDLVLLHVGLTTFIDQGFSLFRKWKTVGIFTCPLYKSSYLLKIGFPRLWSERYLTFTHMIGSFVPRWLLRIKMQRCGLYGLVVQTETTKMDLLALGLWNGDIQVIAPGVDETWLHTSNTHVASMRHSLGYTSEDHVVCYFGSTARLRGLPLLLQAIDSARQVCPSLKLLVVNRRHQGGMKEHVLSPHQYLSGRSDYLKLVDGFLTQPELFRLVSCSDLVAFPYELVPSDAPLSLLEAGTLGLPLLVTRVACLPELVESAHAYLVTPGSLNELISVLIRSVQEKTTHQPKSISQVRSWQAVGCDWVDYIEAM